MSYLMGLQQGAHQYLSAGYGSFGYEPTVSYLFGFPRAIEPGGVVMNVRLTTVTGTSLDDREQYRDFSFQTGLLSSALEHAVPEKMFADEDGEALSAVKALSKAAVAGQKIYHVTSENQAAILPSIRHDMAIMSEIKTALASGREVITHADAVGVPGWSGAGYVIFDPDTGGGAYKIAGGQNGSFLKTAKAKILAFLAWFESLGVAGEIGFGLITIIIGAISNAIDLLMNCADLVFALAMVAILVLVAVLVEAILVISGVGLGAAILIGIAVGMLENLAVDWFKKEAPPCRGAG